MYSRSRRRRERDRRCAILQAQAKSYLLQWRGWSVGDSLFHAFIHSELVCQLAQHVHKHEHRSYADCRVVATSQALSVESRGSAQRVLLPRLLRRVRHGRVRRRFLYFFSSCSMRRMPRSTSSLSGPTPCLAVLWLTIACWVGEVVSVAWYST